MPAALPHTSGTGSPRYVQDPIHGTIALSPLESWVIDHPFVQRLRGIKQLGNASMVFPGATHTRFCHSIGVMHQAGELFESLTQRSRPAAGRESAARIPSKATSQGRGASRRLKGRTKRSNIGLAKNHLGGELERIRQRVHQRVRLAGLLHDLGHGPFSHHFEHFLEAEGITVRDLLDTDLGIPVEWLNPKLRTKVLGEPLCHEHLSAALIARLGIPEEDAQAVVSLLDPSYVCGSSMERDLQMLCTHYDAPASQWPSLLRCFRSLISSELDADRMDYLRRDAHFCGINVTTDTTHLLRSLSLAYHNGHFVIGIDRNAIFALEQHLLARKQMFSQVYQNRVNLVMDDLLSRAMEHARLSGLLEIPRSIAQFLKMDDGWLQGILRSLVSDEVVSRVAHRSGDLATKMYLTRTLPITTESREVKISELSRVERQLKKKHPRGIVFATPQKALLESKASTRDGLLFTQEQRDSGWVPVHTVSELLCSNAWRNPSFRVLALEPLYESAIKRDLATKLRAEHPEQGLAPAERLSLRNSSALPRPSKRHTGNQSFSKTTRQGGPHLVRSSKK